MSTPDRRSSGATLIEMMVFGAIASIVLVLIIGLLSRGSKILDLGRRTSGTQNDLRILLETLAEDAAELVYLEGSGAAFDSSGTASFGFVIRSTRGEYGLSSSATGSGGLRRIEYKVEGTKPLKDCVRSATILGPGGQSSSRTIVKEGLAKLKIWAVAAVPQGPSYKLVMATQASAHTTGATVACLVVDVSAGQTVGDTALESAPVTSIVTKLWCRNRVLELSRGALR